MSEFIKWINIYQLKDHEDKIIRGGSERGSTTLISIGYIDGSIIPGKVVGFQVGRSPTGYFVDSKRAREHENVNFCIATGNERDFKWVSQSGPFNKFSILASGGIPVDGGREPINGGYDMNPLYFARAPVSVGNDIDIICGWVSEGVGAVVSYDKTVHVSNEYEVLVYTGPSVSTPEPFPLHLTYYYTRLIVSEYIKWVDYEKGCGKIVQGMIPRGIKGVSIGHIARMGHSDDVFPGCYESGQDLGYINTPFDRDHEREIHGKFQIAIGDERNFKWVAQSGRFNRSSILRSGCIPVEIGHVKRSILYPTFAARARLAHEEKSTDFAYGWVEDDIYRGINSASHWLDHNGKIVEVTEYEVLALCISTPPTFPQLPLSMARPWLPSPLPDLPTSLPQPELPSSLPGFPSLPKPPFDSHNH